jgi:hypothetical protein
MIRALGLLALVLFWPTLATASGWNNVDPGITTTVEVRERFGAPSRETHAKVEGYDTTQWIYEGSRAPAGILRITVDFGILTPAGYKPTTVRLLKLEPKPLIFGRNTVVEGWGIPDGIGDAEGLMTFFYRDGLFVVFDKAEGSATSMIFSVPQPEPAKPGTSSSPPSTR